MTTLEEIKDIYCNNLKNIFVSFNSFVKRQECHMKLELLEKDRSVIMAKKESCEGKKNVTVLLFIIFILIIFRL